MKNIKTIIEKKEKFTDMLTAVLFFLLIFRDVLEGYFGLPYVGYLDEMTAVLAVPLFALEIYRNRGIPEKKYGIAVFLAVLCVIGWISGLVFRYQNLSCSLTDFILLIKFWLTIYVGTQIAGRCSEEAFRKISKISLWLLIAFLVLTVLDYRLHLFYSAEDRYGIRSEQLFFSHVTVFCAVTLTLTSAYFVGLPEDKRPNVLILVIGCFLMCSTLRTKAFAAAFVMLGLYCLFYLLKRRLRLRTLLLFIPAVIWIAWKQISIYFSGPQNMTARNQLLEKSVLIAKDHFPLGAGFGTFGSYASTVNYSPLYELYGISGVAGLTPEDPSFVMDSFWPMILAQFGVFGLILYLILLLLLFGKIEKVRSLSLHAHTGCLYLFIYLLISSAAESAFAHPAAVPMALLLGMCFGRCGRKSTDGCVKDRKSNGSDVGGNTETGKEKPVQHIFLVGAKSLGAYGGYETFIDKLTEYHRNEPGIKYHVSVKKNGYGSAVPAGAVQKDGGYDYHNADCFEIAIPEWMGPAQAIYYDCKALERSLKIIERDRIGHPIIYVMTCRIGPFFPYYTSKIRKLGGKVFLNPDGHEWLRGKWSAPVRKYWKYSEQRMVESADLIVCDSVSIEKYIKESYGVKNTVFIAYGAETEKSGCPEERYETWLKEKGLRREEYYLIVGRFVPENNYETIIREYMKSGTEKKLVIITNDNPPFLAELERRLKFERDPRIRLVGTVYDQELLKKIREEAYGYIHGHEVGGTNPSLLEALASTSLNLLLDVEFNREVGEDAVLYWTKEKDSLKNLIDRCEDMEREPLGVRAKERIGKAYSWQYIADRYAEIWRT